MGYTHGTAKDAETRICTKCNREFPNTKEFFYYSNSNDNFMAVCKECGTAKNKKRNEEMKKRFTSNKIVYDGEKVCKKCKRSLPNSYCYFPIDKSCVSGLRNICRECNPKYSGFLKADYDAPVHWTKEEDELMFKHYQHYTGIELHEKFLPNRTIRAIESRAGILGISGKTEEAFKRSQLHKGDILSNLFKGREFKEESKIKLSQSLKEHYKTHDGWWKGKTRSPEQCKQMSERQKGKWAGNKNPRHIKPLCGSENGRWKGGINATYFELRSETKDWMQNSMEFCNYHCVITGGDFDNIHHTTPFRNIVDEVFDITHIEVKPLVRDYSKEEFQSLVDQTHKLHNKYGYGACVHYDVHKLFHDVYGYTHFTPKDFLHFINDIYDGKYDDWFKEYNLPININEQYVKYLENII